MLRSWKSLGLALATVLGILLVAQGAGIASPASAAPTGINVSSSNVTSGASFTVTADFNSDEQILEIAGENYLSGVSQVAVTFSSVSGGGTLTDTEGIADIFRADPSALDGDANDEAITVTATAVATCATAGTFQVRATQGTTQHSVTVSCSPASSPTATGTPATATPTVTGTVQPVGSLTVSVAPSTLSCSGSAFVTVVAKNSAGGVIAGGTITLSTNLGTISPTSAVDSGAGVLAVLSGNNQGGTATITATAGGVTGTGTATINCAAATATSVPPTAVPQAPSGVQPPRTGDAGLADHGRSNAALIAGLLLLGLSAAGAVRLAWPRLRS